MVTLGTIIGLSAVGLLIFFRNDISTALGNLKGFGSEFGRDFGSLPDITINVPDFGIPEAGATLAGGAGQAQEAIFKAGVEARKGFDESIQQAQRNFEGNVQGIQQGIAEAQESSLVLGADIQETFTGNRNAIGDFFGNLFGNKQNVEQQIEKPDGAPITTPTVTTPATIERAGGRRTFGGQTAPKMTLTKMEASTPEQSKVIISKQPDLSLVSPFIKTQEVRNPPFSKTPRFSGGGSRR